MGDHDSLRLGGEGGLQLGDVDVVLGHGHVHKHGHRAVLDGRGHGGGEAAGHGDDLVALPDLAVTQLGGGQRHEGDQVGGGTAVDQMGELNADPLGKFLFELVGKAARRQPEVQRGIGQSAHLLLVKDAGCVGDAITLLIGGLFLLEVVIILGDHRLDLLAGFCLVLPHNYCSSKKILISFSISAGTSPLASQILLKATVFSMHSAMCQRGVQPKVVFSLLQSSFRKLASCGALASA